MNYELPVQLLIADDHDIYRDGLRLILEKSKEISIVAEAANGKELCFLAKKYQPDVILTDIVMPQMDGIEATRVISRECPGVNVIALSMYNEDNLIIDMLEAGAKGYLIKSAQKSEIVDAVKSVTKNIPYYCRSTTTKLARLIAHSQFNPYRKTERVHFTEKEIEVIQLICQEKTTKEIADKLFLSYRTIEGYRQRLLEKMEVKSTAGIVIYAIKTGLYKI
jgi:DNA-binding NarL/FixJ family response regulator